MNFHFARLRPGETDYEVIWVVILIVSALLGSAWLAFQLPQPACVFHAVSGFPCLSCGATRSAMALGTGHWKEALSWNPLFFGIYVLLFLYTLYMGIVILFRLPRLRIAIPSKNLQRSLRGGILVLIIINWIYLILHFRTLGV